MSARRTKHGGGGGKEFFREGSHFANLDITPRNLQMGTVVKEKKKEAG